MKKYILLLFLTLSIPTFGQKKQSGPKKIKAFKIAYLSDKLDLTEDEATKFWPIYNKYDKKINGFRILSYFSLKKRLREKGGINSLSEKEAKEIVLQFIKIDKEIAKANQEYQEKLISILPYKKIIRLKIAENEFQRKLLKRLRGKKRPKN